MPHKDKVILNLQIIHQKRIGVARMLLMRCFTFFYVKQNPKGAKAQSHVARMQTHIP